MYTPGTNRLDHIRDRNNGSTAHNSNYNVNRDIKDQVAGNYAYDAIGNLKSAKWMGDDTIRWNIYGKVTEVVKRSLAGVTSRFMHYYYDPSGNRVGQAIQHNTGPSAYFNYLWYVRDAQGNVLAVYRLNNAAGPSSSGLKLAEHYIYGSSRLGVALRDQDVDTDKVTAVEEDNLGDTYLLNFTRGKKLFELTNHLGSILVTVDDTRWGSPVWDNPSMVNYWNPKIVSATEHYPYGMLMRNSYASIEYRYGFNGKEYENEVQAAGNLLDYGNRLYDPLAGRFWSVDPLTRDYAFYSPYQYAGNKPTQFTDLDGLEENSTSTYVRIRVPILSLPDKNKILPAPKAYYFQTDTRTSEQRQEAMQRAEYSKTMNRMFNTDQGWSFRMLTGMGQAATLVNPEAAATKGISDGVREGDVSEILQAAVTYGQSSKVRILNRGYQEISKSSVAAKSNEISQVFNNNAPLKQELIQQNRINNLQSKFEELAETHLLNKYRQIDPNLKSGYTGSFSTGKVGNPTKSTFGQPVDLNNFDIDFWIESDALYKKFGGNLRADPEFRKILNNTPGFEGLKPNKQGFSIKFKPASK
jgi:RHS repeat-associated protein